MAQITAAMVKELRDRSMAGMADCKKALEETSGDMEKAADWLRKKGITKAGQAQTRVATEGAIQSYIHLGGKIGVLLEVNCQTDFVARTDDFKNFCKDIAMHIAGRDPYPLFVSDDEIPAAAVEKERAFHMEKARENQKGKPENIIANIVEGQIKKWKKDICLLDQEFVKDPTKDIRSLMLELSAKTGEKISIRRFVRYALGEGMQKKSEDFASEVAAQVEKAAH
ncbi:MAG TPA: translation elongation factor Ts [Pseudomonadota bacterium]|nr:translation elongation factor Ts [Pseudomonadota bacterium]